MAARASAGSRVMRSSRGDEVVAADLLDERAHQSLLIQSPVQHGGGSLGDVPRRRRGPQGGVEILAELEAPALALAVAQPLADADDVGLCPPLARGAVAGEHLAGAELEALAAVVAGVCAVGVEDDEAVGTGRNVHDDDRVVVEVSGSADLDTVGQVAAQLALQVGLVEGLYIMGGDLARRLAAVVGADDDVAAEDVHRADVLGDGDELAALAQVASPLVVELGGLVPLAHQQAQLSPRRRGARSRAQPRR